MIHGVRASYQAGCRCLPCRVANARYRQERRQAVRSGASGWLSATETRRWLQSLQAAGVGTRRIAQLAGVDRTDVQRLLHGRYTRVRQDVAAKLRAILPSLAPQVSVPVGPTRQLLASLTGEGYTQLRLAAWLGASSGRIWCRRRTVRRVRVRTAVKVRLLWDTLMSEAA